MITETASARRRSPLGSAQLAAVWLPAVMLCISAVLAGLMIWQNYRAEFASSKARALASAQVVAAHLGWMMEASEQALRRIDTALSDEPVVDGLAGTITDISQAVGDLPAGFQYSLHDEAGRLRVSSFAQALEIDVSDREYFQRLRDGESLVVSPQLEERLSGEQVFVVARRISRGGNFYGAATIAIPTRSMDEFWTSMELGVHSTVSVIRTDGWLVARHRQLPESIDLSETQLFTQYLPEADAGVYPSAVSPADGLSRIVGYQKVKDWPLIATAGIETGEALRYFWTSLKAVLLIGLPLMGLLALGIGWVIRLLRAEGRQREALEQALERNGFLFREIHHRVKNNLQAVSSLVQLHQMPKDSKDALGRRIAAMVAVHEQIYSADQFDRIDIGAFAERLIKDVAAGYPVDVTIETKLAPLAVGADQALPLALILNEALSNAFKYAFSEKNDGRLLVELSGNETEGRLVISDNGPGYAGETKKGMVSRLIDGFVSQLGGTLQVGSHSGTKVIISFPVR